jgi:hypothetical protein
MNSGTYRATVCWMYRVQCVFVCARRTANWRRFSSAGVVASNGHQPMSPFLARSRECVFAVLSSLRGTQILCKYCIVADTESNPYVSQDGVVARSIPRGRGWSPFSSRSINHGALAAGIDNWRCQICLLAEMQVIEVQQPSRKPWTMVAH